MKNTKWFFHPIFVFVSSILALGLSLFLYIYWYMEVSDRLERVIRSYKLDAGQFLDIQTWVVIMTLSILVGLILAGIFIIFVYNMKTVRLYRLQHNFINNFTHELKTPVTSLKLVLETFVKYKLPRDEQLRFIGNMLADVERLTGNINRILNLARIEGKTYKGEFVRDELVHVVERFCRENRHILRGSEIRLHNPSGLSFPYLLDLSLFEMLLMNLLTNAIKYNDSVRPEIDITFIPGKSHLTIRFEDNGIGIDGRNLKRIFKKFYQVEQPENAPPKGSGLGLYLVESIARIHKGKVVAESKGPGQGSAFNVMLPIRGETNYEKVSARSSEGLIAPET